MIRRWRDIILLALVGLVVFEVVLPLATDFARSIKVPVYYSYWLIWVATFLGLAAVSFLASEPFRFNRRQLRLLLTQPPLWLAVLLALGLAVVAESLPESLRLQHRHDDWVTPSMLGLLVASFAAGVILRHASQSSSPQIEFKTASATRVGDWNTLREWVLSDEPSAVDLFNHRHIAARMAEHLSSENLLSTSVALLGDYGTGKTSIVNWAKAVLAKHGTARFVFVDLNCWGIVKDEDLPRIALANIVDKLDELIDVRELRSLPNNYQQLVQSEPSGLLSKIIQTAPSGDSFAELKRLSPLLRSAGLRVLLVIEDADRTSEDFQTRHLERLLWALKGVEGVSFILSFDHLRTKLDAFKLCDTVELITLPEADEVRRLIALAYKHWREDFDYIDPIATGHTSDDDPWETNLVDNEMMSYLRGAQRDGTVDSLVLLMKSPRNLKHVLRRTESAWRRLHGEVRLSGPDPNRWTG